MFTTAPRLELQALLKQLGTPHVYFQQPPDKDMQYPCIVYAIDNARTEFAGNLPYMYSKRYQLTVIHEDPDSDIPDKVAMLQMCIFDRHFTANNLHHSVFTLYF